MNLREPQTVWDAEAAAALGLKYYNADMHRSAFVLPTFMRRMLEEW